LAPQAVFDGLCSQTPPEQQPLQLPGPQLAVPSQLPEAPHVFDDAAQSTQAAPPWPQAVSLVPLRHWLFLQQPAQLVHPGVPPSHAPVVTLHVLPVAAQSTQAAPDFPQAPSLVPPRHWLFLQQPEQLVHPGDTVWQTPVAALQLLPVAAQSVHAPPPCPHALSLVPLRHWLLLQQPPHAVHPGVPLSQAPVVALQLLLEALQSTHAAPPLPHDVSALPPRHWLFLQQPVQPVQPAGAVWHMPVAALHVFPDAVQSVHATPPVPQDVSAPPA
jgi:hypothetical protein